MKEDIKSFDDFYCKGKKYNLTKEMFIYRDTSYHEVMKFVFYIPELKRFVSLKVDTPLCLYKHDHITMAQVFEKIVLSEKDHPLVNLSLLMDKSHFKFACIKQTYLKSDLIQSYEKNLNNHWYNTKGNFKSNWHVSYEKLYSLEEEL